MSEKPSEWIKKLYDIENINKKEWSKFLNWIDSKFISKVQHEKELEVLKRSLNDADYTLKLEEENQKLKQKLREKK